MDYFLCQALCSSLGLTFSSSLSLPQDLSLCRKTAVLSTKQEYFPPRYHHVFPPSLTPGLEGNWARSSSSSSPGFGGIYPENRSPVCIHPLLPPLGNPSAQPQGQGCNGSAVAFSYIGHVAKTKKPQPFADILPSIPAPASARQPPVFQPSPPSRGEGWQGQEGYPEAVVAAPAEPSHWGGLAQLCSSRRGSHACLPPGQAARAEFAVIA